MDLETFRTYCLSLPGTSEKLPFDESTLVFYVMDKMFVATDIDNFEYANLKCDPELALDLRERYPAVKPGYHMNKKHWNSVYFDGSIPDKTILAWTKNSYDLVVAKLTKKVREELKMLEE